MTATDFFAGRYRNKSARELAQLAAEEDKLVPEAREALHAEIARRPQPVEQAFTPALATAHAEAPASAQAPASAEDSLDGVRGWLFLYCLLLIIACIRSTISTITTTINGGIPLAIALLVLAVVGWDVATAVAILVRTRFALRMVLIQLITSAVATVFVLGAQNASLLTSNEPEKAGVLLLTSVLDVASIFVWYRYFCVSKRVKITFGRNL
jgi:cation transport ATPase